MIHKSLLISFLFVYTSSFSQTIEYNGKDKYKLEQAINAIKTADPAYAQILNFTGCKITLTSHRFSTIALDSLGSDWILVQSSYMKDEDYKMIAATIIHESLHLYYRKTGQYTGFANVYEEEVQAYSYARNFLIEIGGKLSDIQWYNEMIKKYTWKSGT